jgi:hypothetical protein
MAAGDIYRKTDRGAAEIADRRMKVSPRLRTMLILIDGARPEFLVKEEGEKVGAPPDFLEQLVALGLIEKVGRASAAPAGAPRSADEFMRFRAAKDFMNTTIVDALGMKSFFFTMKLERAGTVADLREIEPAYREALAKAVGEAEAEVLAGRLDEMLR